MRALNWEKGIFRLWVVGAAIWTIFVVVVLAQLQMDISGLKADIDVACPETPAPPEGYTLDRSSRQAPSDNGCPIQYSQEQISQARHLVDLTDQRRSIALYLLAPLGVLALGVTGSKAGKWVVAGFFQ